MSSKLQQVTSADMKRQRILGRAENALVETSIRHQGYMRVGEVLHLQGPRISLSTLTSAVDCLQRRHPFLRSRIDNNSAKSSTYLMNEDTTLRLKISEISRKRDDHLYFWCREWYEREKETVVIGQGLAEFWLLQDPDDDDVENAPREIVFICEHSICDGLSLSTVAHELLIALSDDNNNMFTNSLDWPLTIETAIQQSLSTWTNLVTFGKFLSAVVHRRITNTQNIARIPINTVDFSLDNMSKYSHTEFSYTSLTKEETQKLMGKCRLDGVTVTSAVSSAILCATSAFVTVADNYPTQLTLAIAVDTRRRCIPPVPNHDLSYQVSEIMTFKISTRDIPTTVKDMWQLANIFGHHVKTSIDAGQSLAHGMLMGKFYRENIEAIDLTKLPTCEISNWGLLPFHEQYGNWKLEAMTPFSNMIRSAVPFIFIYTVNGILSIGYLGAAPIIAPNILESLCNATISHLRQMIEA